MLVLVGPLALECLLVLRELSSPKTRDGPASSLRNSRFTERGSQVEPRTEAKDLS